MAKPFRKPDTKRDWRVVVEQLSLGGLEFLSGNIVNTYDRVKAAITESRHQYTVDEVAWIWLRVTVTSALLQLLSQTAGKRPLSEGEKKSAKTFIADALALEGGDQLDMVMVMNPAASPPLAPIIVKLPDFVRCFEPDHDRSDALIQTQFARLLRSISARVYALDVPFYKPVADAITSPFSEAERRDFAWARHHDWIRGLFDRDRVFSFEEDDKAPTLRDVYFPLRCYWHELEEAEDAGESRRGLHDDDEAQKMRIAHLGVLHETLHAWLAAPGERDNIRVVAGGPSCGKSSFSRAFAHEVVADDTRHVLYIKLQHMKLGTGALHEQIGQHLRRRFDAVSRDGTEGFEENPLDWTSYDKTPMLLIFDGLDELSPEGDAAAELLRQFISKVGDLLSEFRGRNCPARAMILGRSAACQAAIKEARLNIKQLIHVAPITEMDEDTVKPADGVRNTGDTDTGDMRAAAWRCLTQSVTLLRFPRQSRPRR